MRLLFEKQFLKDVNSITDRADKGRIQKSITGLKEANTLQDIHTVKKMRGHSNAYRLRIGSFRLGFIAQEDTLILIRILHRKDIYKFFPK